MINIELKALFSAGTIGSVKIKNRIVRSATWVARASEKGEVTEQLIDFYRELAEGGTGLIISGYIAVHPKGAATRCMACIYDDSYKSGQKRLVEAVRNYSDVKIAAQLAHTGSRTSNPKIEPIGPSPLRIHPSKRMARELKNEEIRKIIDSFVDAGLRAYECGYDMVQIHAAHGYLLSDFISPFTNKRIGEYGGDTQNRVKILTEIYNQLRDKLGRQFPIIIKLNIQDYLQGGLTFEEGKEIVKILVDTGFDAIEPSSGRTNLKVSGNKTFPAVSIKSLEEENYFLPNVKELKPLMKNCSLIMMGGIRTPLSANRFLQEQIADFISMSRPLLCEPDLPNRWISGDTSPALCNSCNACFEVRGPIYCVVKNKLQKKNETNK